MPGGKMLFVDIKCVDNVHKSVNNYVRLVSGVNKIAENSAQILLLCRLACQ